MRIPSRAPRASRAVKVLALAALPLVLTACSTSTGALGSPTFEPTPVKGSPGVLTGARLKKSLQPASFFPAGFEVILSGDRDSGDWYVTATTGPAAKLDCARLPGTAWITAGGETGVSWAQNDYVNPHTSVDLAQEIDAYPGATADEVVKSLARVVTRCRSFIDPDTHNKVTASGHVTQGLGDDAYTITLTNPAWASSDTLIAARVGSYVVSVLSTDKNYVGKEQDLARAVVSSLKKQI